MGGIQIFLVLDLKERIKAFYIQNMTSEYAGKFRDAEFGKQFIGLTLEDFEHYDVITGKATGKASGIKNPAPEAEYDFKYIMRGTKKNLILVNEFIRMSPVLSSCRRYSGREITTSVTCDSIGPHSIRMRPQFDAQNCPRMRTDVKEQE